MKFQINKHNLLYTFLFVLIATLSIFSRFYGIFWDQGFPYTPHPDERAILMKVAELKIPQITELHVLFSAQESLWNTKWFPYGTFPIYFLKILYEIIDFNLDIRIIGRSISAFCDLLTILGVFILGKSVINKNVGILASLIVCITPIHIQLSHFFAFDTILTMFCVWSIYFLFLVSKYGHFKYSLISAILIFLGLATKVSITPILMSYLIAHIFFYFTSQNNKSLKILSNFSIGIFIGLVVYFIVSPYTFLDYEKFIADFIEQSEMVRRIRDYPYTRTYIDTVPYIYQFNQMWKWILGFPLTIFITLGFLWYLSNPFSLFKSKIIPFILLVFLGLMLIFNNSSLMILTVLLISMSYFLITYIKPDSNSQNIGIALILSWVIPYFLITGSFEVKFNRYLLPLIPFLIILGSGYLIHLYNCSQKKLLILFLGTVVVTSSSLMSFGILNLYSSDHSAVSASKWINQNIDPGSVILKEHWDESLPNLTKYQLEEVAIYEPDSISKITEIANQLSHSEYIIIFSNRLYGTVSRLPERYPYMIEYYSSLFKGQLGYELIHFEEKNISFLGVTLYEETFKSNNLPNPLPQVSSNHFLSFSSDKTFSEYDHPKILIFQNTQKFSSTDIKNKILNNSYKVTNKLKFEEDLLSQQRKGGTWIKIFNPESSSNWLSIIKWFFAIELLSIIAIPITFLIFQKFQYRGFLLNKVIGLLIIGYASWVLNSLQILKFTSTNLWLIIFFTSLISGYIFYIQFNNITKFFYHKWKEIAALEIFFISAFILFVIIRLLNPDLWHPYRGGEKPMDLAYLNAVIKSSYMPPYDPWFSGGYLNYYYFGQYLIGCLIHLTGIPTEISYNLAIPFLFAATASISLMLGINLIEFNGIRAKTHTKLVIGFLTFFMICILGNFEGLFQVINIVTSNTSSSIFTEFNFWQSTRIMTPDPPGFEINEFPFFTFLFADLHAHLISIPFFLIILSLCLNHLKSSNNKFSEIIILTFFGFLIGSIRVINTWDFPTSSILSISTLIFSEYLKNGGINLLVISKGIYKWIYVMIISVALFFPFHQSTITFFTTIELTTNVTTINQFLIIHGLHLFIFSSGILILMKSNYSINQIVKTTKSNPIKYLIGLLSILTILYFTSNYSLVLSVSTAISLGLFLLFFFKLDPHNKNNPSLIFSFILTILGMCLVAGIEIFRIAGDIDRMNTVFKFYMQIWILFSIASGYFIYEIYQNIKQNNSIYRYSWSIILSTLIISQSIYPILGTIDRINDRFETTGMTLNGYEFTKTTKYKDPNGEIDLKSEFEAIYWLRNNVKGSPVILEAFTPSYRLGSRISINTGLPTIIGWEWHQQQQRWDFKREISDRINDVNSIYSEIKYEDKLKILKKYDVKFIVIGGVEKNYYGSDQTSKLTEQLLNDYKIVFENENVKILKEL